MEGLTKDWPKCLLDIHGVTPLALSLAALQANGIRTVILVTGHVSEAFDRLEVPAGLHLIKIYNAAYATAGNAVSLAVGLRACDGPCLILDSDILYEPAALVTALSGSAENLIILAGPSGSGDEFHTWADSSGHLHHQSKNRAAIAADPVGEVVGILRCGNALRAALLHTIEHLHPSPVNVEYEEALVRVSAQHPIKCIVMQDLIWCEIDDEAMLEKARDTIFPALKAKAEAGN